MDSLRLTPKIQTISGLVALTALIAAVAGQVPSGERIAIYSAFAVVLAAAVPALIAAITEFRKTRTQVGSLHDKLGEPNGSGTFTQMVQASIDVSQRQLEATSRLTDRLDRHADKLRHVGDDLNRVSEDLGAVGEKVSTVDDKVSINTERLTEIELRLGEVELRLGDVEHITHEKTEIARLHAEGRLRERASDLPPDDDTSES